ncbi:hypothetical protein L195_g038015, partial [Trifolium pratense]
MPFNRKRTNFLGNASNELELGFEKKLNLMQCCIGKRADCNNRKWSQFSVAMKGGCYKNNSKNKQTCLLSINSVIE